MCPMRVSLIITLLVQLSFDVAALPRGPAHNHPESGGSLNNNGIFCELQPAPYCFAATSSAGSDEVILQMEGPKDAGWLALGIGKDHTKSDLMVAWRDASTGVVIIKDMHSTGRGRYRTDRHQDLRMRISGLLHSTSTNDTRMTVKFSRKAVTLDRDDAKININSTVNWVWAMGRRVPSNENDIASEIRSRTISFGILSMPIALLPIPKLADETTNTTILIDRYNSNFDLDGNLKAVVGDPAAVDDHEHDHASPTFGEIDRDNDLPSPDHYHAAPTFGDVGGADKADRDDHDSDESHSHGEISHTMMTVFVPAGASNFTVLFQGWTVTNGSALTYTWTLLVLILSGIICEALSFVRPIVEQRVSAVSQQQTAPFKSIPASISGYRWTILTYIVSLIVKFCETAINAFMMLVLMTFDPVIFVGVVLGWTFGYTLFAPIRLRMRRKMEGRETSRLVQLVHANLAENGEIFFRGGSFRTTIE
ncbi:DOMON domain-containing protein [Cladochytrium replicatum]|nr:DOMON domain-containing protein [Cladochytrium replicatum]